MKFRKKPVVIEAVQFVPNTTDHRDTHSGPVLRALDEAGFDYENWRFAPDRIEIPTLEGTMTASPGDWIIKGVHGECYPIKPEIFEESYELVLTPPTTQDPIMSQRKLTSHKVNGLNEDLTIAVVDDPGHGGASHHYSVEYNLNPGTDAGGTHLLASIRFQEGPVQEFGINGISNEALLAIVEDRLTSFQKGDFACRENALAITKLQEAMMWLHQRTRNRLERGVEGTHQV